MLDFMGKNALVIEDDDDIRGLLEIVLGQMGFTVTAVDTGTAGLSSAQALSPDLVTLDIGLPDVDGVSVLRELRTFHEGTVVMLSARGQQGDIDAAMAAGASGYLLKPFRPASLKQELVAILAS
ncbi:response regulator [Specibacter sp. NPDC078692]|uniref:response regulator transcription factor n=1 Tax=Specibacter sp. NPDC078692 TaxID=3155818 RepID=UPI003425FF02